MSGRAVIDRADREWALRGPDLEPAAEGVLEIDRIALVR